MYFVIRKKHNVSGWDNTVVTSQSKDDALHLFHAFMSTYAYGQSSTLDYVSCSVENDDGVVIMREVDDKRGEAE